MMTLVWSCWKDLLSQVGNAIHPSNTTSHTPYQHIISHALSTQHLTHPTNPISHTHFQHIITHHINTPLMLTLLSTYPINPTSHTPSAQPINTPSHATLLSTHPLNPTLLLTHPRISNHPSHQPSHVNTPINPPTLSTQHLTHSITPPPPQSTPPPIIPGGGMQSIYMDLPRPKENDQHFKMLCNPELLFPDRLYPHFGPEVRADAFTLPVVIMTSDKPLYFR